MKLIPESIQQQLPEGVKITMLTGGTMTTSANPGYNSGYDKRDKLTAMEIQFQNGFALRIVTEDYKGLILEEVTKPL